MLYDLFDSFIVVPKMKLLGGRYILMVALHFIW